MIPFEIYIVYVTWEKGGKNRPVLVLGVEADKALILNITTKYDNKSEVIRSQYFKINEYKQAGLDRQSYVDVMSGAMIPVALLANKTPIGKLTEADKQRLRKFLSNLNIIKL